jgi:kynurenine formamidase
VRIEDLSHVVVDGMTTYPGLPGPRITDHLTREASREHYASGTEFHIGRIDMVANTGTYLDTPAHRFAGATDLANTPLESMVELDGVVVHAVGLRVIDLDALADRDVGGRAVLLRTDHARHWGTDAYFRDHPFVNGDAAAWLVDHGAELVGIDSLNIDDTSGGERPAHTALLEAGIPIVEHLTNLSLLPLNGARFTAVPPKIAGLGTFTVRAFAVVPESGESDRPAVCGVVVDCHDPGALASFWSHVVGGTARVRSDMWATVRDARPGGVLLAFQRVPEGKTVKNRVHLDVWSTDIPADTQRLVALGATRQGELLTDATGSFQILLDPEGNEFCLVD